MKININTDINNTDTNTAATPAASQRNTGIIIRTLLTAGTLLTATLAHAANVTIETARGQASLPKNPAKVATFDLAALDTLDALGVTVGATTDKQYIDYLQKAAKSATNVGTLFNPDVEALHAYQPDLLIVGTRSAPKYDELKKHFPNTIDMTAHNERLFSDGLQRLTEYGKLFDKTEKAAVINNRLTQLINDTRELAADKGTGLILIVSGSRISAFGPQSRLGWIHNTLHIKQADKNISAARHGQPVTFEYISKVNPDWLFIMDRGAAIGQSGTAAAVTLENVLTSKTKAWQAGQVVYLSPASYIAPGGVRQIQKDVTNIKLAFEKK